MTLSGCAGELNAGGHRRAGVWARQGHMQAWVGSSGALTDVIMRGLAQWSGLLGRAKHGGINQ